MSNINVSLVSNVFIDDEVKLELLKVTISDVAEIFDAAHIKIRGRYAVEAVLLLESLPIKNLILYQQLQEKDWISAISVMLDAVDTRSVFIYFEDHQLLAPKSTFTSVIKQFEALQLDCMCYSWFRASQLNTKNSLPFYSSESPDIRAIEITSESLPLLGKISPRYHTFSLVSIVSVNYLKSILQEENRRTKLYSRTFSAAAARLLRYPKYKKLFSRLNALIKLTNIRLCYYDPCCPFNMERMWLEHIPSKFSLRIGIPKIELFANFDDDNGADGESLTKRGRYPFGEYPETNLVDVSVKCVTKTIALSCEQHFDLSYYSTAGRIRKPPIISLSVKSGRIALQTSIKNLRMCTGDSQSIFANKGATLIAEVASVLELKIFDEVF